MALIGVTTLSLISVILVARSKQVKNKALVLLIWATTVGYHVMIT